eukprot:2921783-Karenia_brevis.AAC.1
MDPHMDDSANTHFPKPRRAELFRSQWMSGVLGGHVHAHERANMAYDNQGTPPMVGYSKGSLNRLAAHRQHVSDST